MRFGDRDCRILRVSQRVEKEIIRGLGFSYSHWLSCSAAIQEGRWGERGSGFPVPFLLVEGASTKMTFALIDHPVVIQSVRSRQHREAFMPAASANARQDLPHLARIDPSQFDLLFSGCKLERYAAGQHLFLQEDAADRIFGVMSGTVEISIYSPDGQKLVANIELSRSLVGEIGALDGRPRTATAICLTACELVSLSRTHLFDRIEKNPSLARAMIELLCARLRWVSGELGDQAFFGIEARLAKRLVFLEGVMADGAGWISISQSELGEFLGVTRESINKTLNDWRNRRVIAIRRGGLRISDAGALRRIAESQDDY
jgi:CRP/FNR family transcriptional regulator, cyclic AMP receptor protein